MPRSPFVVQANAKISFLRAARLAGIGTGERERGMKVTCPACGGGGSLRVWSDHGWCFGEQRYFTPVSLLAEVWEMDEESAAVRLLAETGTEMPGFEGAWEAACQQPPPARESLAQALRVWCEANCADWRSRQYEDAAATLLARCLGLLPQVHTAEQCERWLAVSKVAMGRVLSGTGALA
jgi:hypothetical protein